MNFDIQKTIQYWLESASYDLETGKALIESKKFPYALFFGHLAIEKLLKALVVKVTKEHSPFTHSLVHLASKLDFKLPESIFDKLAEFMEFHLEARYPDDKKDFYKKCTETFTRQKFSEIEEVYQWIMKRLDS